MNNRASETEMNFSESADFSGTMIFSDYDGTLTDNKGKIPQNNVDALRFYTSHGGKFTVCTGRTVQGFHAYDKDFINAPIVLANGSLCYDYNRGEVVFFEGIEDEGIEFVRAIRDKFPFCSIEIYPLFKTYTVHTSDTTVHHLQGQRISFEEIDDPGGIELPWQKVMIDCGDDSKRVQDWCREKFEAPMFIPTTGRFVEFIRACHITTPHTEHTEYPKEISQVSGGKEFGAFALADKLGIDRKNVICVGDGYNDATMLEAAEESFCPSDASDEARAAAKIQVCSRDEGTLYGVVRELLKGNV